MVYKMTKEQAIKMANSGWWKTLPARQVAEFQLNEQLLCMPFGEFHRVVEEALGRSVWTHEFGLNVEGLRKELIGDRQPPTLDEILELIPKSKRLVGIEK